MFTIFCKLERSPFNFDPAVIRYYFFVCITAPAAEAIALHGWLAEAYHARSSLRVLRSQLLRLNRTCAVQLCFLDSSLLLLQLRFNQCHRGKYYSFKLDHVSEITTWQPVQTTKVMMKRCFHSTADGIRWDTYIGYGKTCPFVRGNTILY